MVSGLIRGRRDAARQPVLSAVIHTPSKSLHMGHVVTELGYVVVTARRWSNGKVISELFFMHQGREHVRWIGKFLSADDLESEAKAFARHAARTVIPEVASEAQP